MLTRSVLVHRSRVATVMVMPTIHTVFHVVRKMTGAGGASLYRQPSAMNAAFESPLSPRRFSTEAIQSDTVDEPIDEMKASEIKVRRQVNLACRHGSVCLFLG
jgi:hypothetical protein